MTGLEMDVIIISNAGVVILQFDSIIIQSKSCFVPTQKVWDWKKCGRILKKEKGGLRFLMKKSMFGRIAVLLLSVICLTGCAPVGGKNASLSVIYAAVAAFSLGLFLASCFVVRQNKGWVRLLFLSVLVVNTGYTLLSVSTCLNMALWSNRISYLGSVFLPLSMLMIILNITQTPYKKCLPMALGAAAVLMFLVAASPGILDIYYKQVDFAVVNGVSTLVKVYGPLHPLYLFYLLSYFSVMVFVIIRARVRKTIDSAAHAAILAIAVLVNIGVWLIGQLVHMDFEMLSVSYIISELFLLGVHLVVREQQKFREIAKKIQAAENYPAAEPAVSGDIQKSSFDRDGATSDRIEMFVSGVEKLTPTERKIFDAYIARASSKEVMESLNITENTLKYHNKNIYGKLGAASRKELLELHKQVCAVKAGLNKTE